MNRVLEVDDVSGAALVEAGASGPQLNSQLAAHGRTLRHFPQSWEFSTVGGWIATRAGGHYATGHTRIDDFVESVRAVTPRGPWESRRLPGSGAGVSPALPRPERASARPAARWAAICVATLPSAMNIVYYGNRNIYCERAPGASGGA